MKMSLYPRDAAFKDGRCVASGCPAALYTKADGYERATIFLPSDHYDFGGPVFPVGLTKAEIEEKVRAVMGEAHPTVIDDVEVFDSEGTLSLKINGYDVLYLSKCQPDPDDTNYPRLSPDQHQRIINVVSEALGFRGSHD
jgi:hypothetical protein